MTAMHIQQLQGIKGLCVGLEWVAKCPDQSARQLLVDLVNEEMAAVLDGVIYSAERLLQAANGNPVEEVGDGLRQAS